jgi:hypothetical protein
MAFTHAEAYQEGFWLCCRPTLPYRITEGLPVIRPESDGEAYDFLRNRSSVLLVKGAEEFSRLLLSLFAEQEY